MSRRAFAWWMVGMLAFLTVAAGTARPAAPAEEARELLRRAGVRGGLVVHVGCADARLTAALSRDGRYLVHGLDTSTSRLRRARQRLQKRDLRGDVTVAHWTGERLPYADNLASVLVVEEGQNPGREEILRVLRPLGVALIRQGDSYRKLRSEWPETMDQWTHYLHGPDNNAVSEDEHVGPPRRLQWRSGPLWCRSHDHLASVSAVVSARGRIFSIVDRGPVASVTFPSRWFLVARDGFNGVKLWEKRIEPWTGRFRGFRSGPPHLARRLVASENRVFVTPGYGKPVVALDAATGQELSSYPETEGAEEVIYRDGVVYAVIGNRKAVLEARRARHRGEESDVGKSIVAVRASTGELLWKRSEEQAGYVMPTTLAASGGRVFYENTKSVVCLDARSGRRIWQSPRPITLSRPTWLAPTLVVKHGVVLSADRDASNIQGAGELDEPGQLKWKISSKEPYRVGKVATGKLYAFSTETGKKLWTCPATEGFNSPPDVLVARGLVWTGRQVRASRPGITKGRDIWTGNVEYTRPPDGEFFTVGMGHHRCYRNRATTDYLVMGRSGIEMIDLDSGKGVADHWVRGACQYGTMPCNGLMYAPPHSCACYIKSKIKGFNALAPADNDSLMDLEARNPLVRGPAYEMEAPKEDPTGEWPTYRQDAARSGAAECAVPAELNETWSASPGGTLSSPVVAGGRLFLACSDGYAVAALDAGSGRQLWRYNVGGRVDSPPTVHQGRVIFGSADGWVYCLRASDGKLAWKFRAAPRARFVVDQGRVESTWPVHGNVLVQNGTVYFVAGRSSYLDGGMYLYGLDPETGEQVVHQRLNSRDPETGLEPQKPVRGLRMPGALPDVLSARDDSIFMRHKRYDLDGNELTQNVPHLFSSVGFLDDRWWHRTYWIIGTSTGSGFGGWRRPGNSVPSGRLLVKDGADVYGFGRNAYRAHGAGGGSHPGLGGIRYELFAASMKNGGQNRRWSRQLPFWVRAMVLTENGHLFAAGPPVAEYLTTEKTKENDQVEGAADGMLGPWYGDYFLTMRNPEEALDAWQGEKGARLWAISAKDGSKLSARRLDALPVFDSMIAANGRLYLCTADGTVRCYGEE